MVDISRETPNTRTCLKKTDHARNTPKNTKLLLRPLILDDVVVETERGELVQPGKRTLCSRRWQTTKSQSPFTRTVAIHASSAVGHMQQVKMATLVTSSKVNSWKNASAD